jgi:outer membrane protein TolC
MNVRGLFVALTTLCVASSVLHGAEPEAAQSEFLRVIANAPALSATARRADAARERANSAGRLPDPEIEGMTSRMNGPMGDRSTMYELNVRQPLPKRGERAADRERTRAGVAMANADHARLMGELAADVAMALAEAESGQQRIRLLETQRERLDAVLRSLEVRLAAGTNSRIADRLTVQSRVASLQLTIEEERKIVADALSEVHGQLGLPDDATLPAYAAPIASDIDVDASAALRLTAARSEEAMAMANAARASAKPMTAVGLRLERERTTMGDEDTIGVAFMSEIPWRSRGYARADIRAAEAERAAAQAEGKAARYRIASAVTRVERAERLAETAQSLSGETLARLHAEYDSLVRSAGVAGAGESTVLQIVELLEKNTETELQVVQANLAARIARADLWRHLPADRFAAIGN